MGNFPKAVGNIMPPRPKIAQLINQAVHPEIRNQIELGPVEVGKRISRLLTAPLDVSQNIVKNAHIASAMDVVFAKIIIDAATTDNPQVRVGCIEFLLTRMHGKPKIIDVIDAEILDEAISILQAEAKDENV